MDYTEEAITAFVLRTIKEFRGRWVTAPPILAESRIVEDLGLDQDAEELVLVLQERTGIKPPPKEWADVRTVEEVIHLLLKYAPNRGQL